MGSTSTHNNVNSSGNDVWDHEQQGEASDRKLGNSLLVQMSWIRIKYFTTPIYI